MDRELFLTVCAELFGEEWHRAAARRLGAHHPDGPRPQIDDRLVRRWAAGDRDIPAWVAGALGLLVEQAALEQAMRLARLRNAADSLRAAILAPAPNTAAPRLSR